MDSFHFEGSSISFTAHGQGNNIMLLFHGFGQTSHAFDELCEIFKDQYVCYCIDLFYHGNSELDKLHNPVSKIFLKKFLSGFFKEKNITTFSVLSFSLGSKMALACTELFPEKVKELYLLAPDSITQNGWYKFATGNQAGRVIFKFVITHPKSWLTALSYAEKTGIVSTRLKLFVASQMHTNSQRLNVYNTWMAFRKLIFDNKKFCEIITTHKIKLTVFVGKHDSVVPPKQVEILRRYLPDFNPILLDCGHTSMIKATASYLRTIKK